MFAFSLLHFSWSTPPPPPVHNESSISGLNREQAAAANPGPAQTWILSNPSHMSRSSSFTEAPEQVYHCGLYGQVGPSVDVGLCESVWTSWTHRHFYSDVFLFLTICSFTCGFSLSHYLTFGNVTQSPIMLFSHCSL